MQLHLNKSHDFWNNILWTDEPNMKICGHNAQCHFWRNPNTAYHHKYMIQAVKHGGGGLMIWCFAATRPAHFVAPE